MRSELSNLRQSDVNLLLGIIDKLHGSHDRDILRAEIADDLLRLLEADFLASFIWNQKTELFEQVVYLNMSPENLKRYDRYYQFHDPITSLLQKRGRATLVGEVMPQEQLERTEFFNDFLMRDGLHHGMNVYAYDGDLNIGDLRIWRARHRPDFGQRETALLDTILPHFRNALRNVRVIEEAQGISGFWPQLLEDSHIGLFLFDQAGNLVHRNNEGKIIEEELSEPGYRSFYEQVCSLARMGISHTEWGPFFLSVASLTSPHDSNPVRVVIAHRHVSQTIDTELLRRKYLLTPRETEICLLVFKGFTDQEIASALGISFHTVRTHLKHAFAKLDATSRSELNYLLLEGIVDVSF